MTRLCILALALFVCVQVSLSQKPKTLPNEVITYMAQRTQRQHHLYFHTVRMHYTKLGPKQQHAIKRLGWEPVRPAFAMVAGVDTAIMDNDNGEDFLFMHRRMIGDVNRISAEVGSAYGKVEGWVTCPAPGSKDWPVPPTYTIAADAWFTGYLVVMKSDDTYWDTIKVKEDKLTEPEYLRTLTLGQLGSILDNEIHTMMHLRFSAANTVGYRLQDTSKPVNEVAASWDVPAYDWLGDFYSAHVNPMFWMIHGWVENRIEMWRVANSIARITWIGTWEGGEITNAILADMYKVQNIVEDGPVAPSDTSDSSDTDDAIDQDSLAAVISLLAKLAKK